MLYFYNIMILHVGFHNLSVVSKKFFSRFFDASFGSGFFSQLFCLALPSSRVLMINHIQREDVEQTALGLIMLHFISGLVGISCPHA